MRSTIIGAVLVGGLALAGCTPSEKPSEMPASPGTPPPGAPVHTDAKPETGSPGESTDTDPPEPGQESDNGTGQNGAGQNGSGQETSTPPE